MPDRATKELGKDLIAILSDRTDRLERRAALTRVIKTLRDEPLTQVFVEGFLGLPRSCPICNTYIETGDEITEHHETAFHKGCVDQLEYDKAQAHIERKEH